MRLDDLRLRVRPGDGAPGQGIVVRFPGVVLVVPGDDWSNPAVRRLVAACRDGEGPLAARVAPLLADAPSFGAVADGGHGLDIVLHGDTVAAVTGAGPVLRLSCVDPAGWSGRLDDDIASLTLGAKGERPPAGGPRFDLWEGVVSGTAAALLLDASGTEPDVVEAAEAAEVFEAAPAPVMTPVEAPVAPVAPVAAPVAPVAPVAPPPPAPGPVAETPANGSAAEDGADGLVWGVHCKRGHFNNPDARYCRMCGAHMAQGRVPTRGPRPVLGYMVLDDGSTYELDRDYVLGRQPERHPAVQADTARGLTLAGTEATLSPAHTSVRLEEWDVIVADCDSVTGTYLWAPGERNWERLTPGEGRALRPGTHVLVGGRSFVFRPVNKR